MVGPIALIVSLCLNFKLILEIFVVEGTILSTSFLILGKTLSRSSCLVLEVEDVFFEGVYLRSNLELGRSNSKLSRRRVRECDRDRRDRIGGDMRDGLELNTEEIPETCEMSSLLTGARRILPDFGGDIEPEIDPETDLDSIAAKRSWIDFFFLLLASFSLSTVFLIALMVLISFA